MGLNGDIIKVGLISNDDKKTMFSLMEEFYDHMNFSSFIRDLNEKDYCIMLYNEIGILKGFSTQRIMEVNVHGENILGVFSGDTIIHKNDWGSLALHKTFLNFFIPYGRKYKEFYWFLISKGYKTYKMLPGFFHKFYPCFQEKTPYFEQELLKSFGREKFPNEYENKKGVICYQEAKDRLKVGIADINDKMLMDKNIEFFVLQNPEYTSGNDLVCIAKLCEENLNKAGKRLLLGK